ncbi:hypothetical protein [Amycolatopsis sp. FDAARGOS 1241]|uniref:hypothetical protein n=1 Tax=Amycolatopsis sp. FDAARGOS 1241 TaxID=2778070 RepID=UPI00194DC18F|nr:hypothetical protein [Amycolatopsis sp. FDAARGOS 1241]QRP49868.1 hypothetical protein I6J71_20305 [Amycolatopsis sp. FDAARGOS 1241]
MSSTVVPSGGSRRKAARAATEVLAPWVWVLGLPLALAWQVTGHRFAAAVLWGLVVGVTGSLIPMAVIVRGAKRGRWDGHHVTNRAGRLVPFTVCFASLATGFLVLSFGGAPRELIALTATELACLAVALAATFGLRFKISIHAEVAAGATMMLIWVYGPWLLLLVPFVAWVAWSRVELGDHTAREVVSGAFAGAVVGGAVYFGLLALLS